MTLLEQHEATLFKQIRAIVAQELRQILGREATDAEVDSALQRLAAQVDTQGPAPRPPQAD